MSDENCDFGTANNSSQSDNNENGLNILSKLIEQEREIDEVQ